VSFQPSELAKITMIVWSAALCIRKAPQFQRLSRGLAPFLVVWAALLLPVLLQPDLSTAAVIGMLGAVVVFAGGARVGHFLFLGLLGAPVLLAQLRVGFRWERLLAFLNPADHADGAGFQVLQSLIAVGSGGLTGLGFGEGRQKFGFLPEAQNDFIFAMVGEEWGLLGVSFLTVLYLSLVAVGFRVASRAPDLFGRLLAIGFSSFIAIHAFLHMAVGLALVPPTGLPLPLVSYGRTNLIVTLMGLGILLSVARGCQEVDERPCQGTGEIDLLWEKAQVGSAGGRFAALKWFFGYGSRPLAGGSRG
jgi:cell division protein FtsW